MVFRHFCPCRIFGFEKIQNVVSTLVSYGEIIHYISPVNKNLKITQFSYNNVHWRWIWGQIFLMWSDIFWWGAQDIFKINTDNYNFGNVINFMLLYYDTKLSNYSKISLYNLLLWTHLLIHYNFCKKKYC